MKISFYPYYTPVDNFGSSRMRAKYPALGINEVTEHEAYVSGGAMDADVIVIGKMFPDHWTQEMVEKLKAFIIWDVCDPYAFKKIPMWAFSKIDLVTVPTDSMKHQVIMEFGMPETWVEVWDDCVDFGLIHPYIFTMEQGVVWYGNYNTIEPSLEALLFLKNKGCEVTIISQKRGLRDDLKSMCVDWNFNTFIKDYRKSGICVSFHDENNHKSDNKTKLSIALGVPCVVNDNTAAARLYKNYNLGHYIVDMSNIEYVIKDLYNWHTKLSFIDISKDIVEKHNYRVKALELIDIIKKHAPISV